jgi:hypothetical protein
VAAPQIEINGEAAEGDNADLSRRSGVQPEIVSGITIEDFLEFIK